MKRFVKIILTTSAIILIILVYIGYHVYQIAMGSESLAGKKEGIPAQIKTLPPLTKGDSDWPNWRGQNFDGKSATKGIRSDWSKGLKKLWQVNYLCQDQSTATWSTPVVQGNRLIVPGRDEKNDLIFCLNSDTGELVWMGSYEAEAEIVHGPGSRATPFISDNRVYTFGRSGDLVCWQLEDGKLLWRRNVRDDGGSEPRWGYSTTPLVYKNMVIVQGGGNATVIAFDKVSGNLIWKSMQGEAGYAAAIPMTIENEVRFIIYHGTGLSCLNPADGKELWTAPWMTKYNVNATTPLLCDDIIFHTSNYDMGCEALKVSSNGYSVLWKNKVMKAQHSDPILIDGFVYGYSGESLRNAGEFKCIELSTGKEMWSTNQIGQGTTTFADDYLVCMDLKGNLYLIKPDPSGFKKIDEIKAAIDDVKNPAWTVPVIANGKLYLRYLQKLICYKIT